MAEDLNIITSTTKIEKYRSIVPQIKALISGEFDLIANAANICAALKEQFGWFWVGFYFVKDQELVLGPFQGPVACTRIAMGKGVFGMAWQLEKMIIVADVDAFPEHIACSQLSKSEIVVPVFKNGKVVAVLDVDSDLLDQFDETDAQYLEQIVKLVKF